MFLLYHIKFEKKKKRLRIYTAALYINANTSFPTARIFENEGLVISCFSLWPCSLDQIVFSLCLRAWLQDIVRSFFF